MNSPSPHPALSGSARPASRCRPRGRWAPSPSGLLHVGGARTALAAWLSVRSRGGGLVWRLEDLDPPRVVPGAAEAGMEDLAWLGLDWDEGPHPDPRRAGPFAPYEQSARTPLYQEALGRLHAAGRLFPCRRSRKDLEAIATAPHGADGTRPYPAALRPRRLDRGWFEGLAAAERPGVAIRFMVHAGPVAFDDRVRGPIVERVDRTAGDFVLRRRDGLWAYQLAVVVDDLAMEIDEVVRGSDLLASTGRQIQLIEALGGRPPAYAHVPLLLAPSGEKLSKRDRGLTLRALRETGAAPERLTGWLAFTLGLLDRPEPRRPAELVDGFDWSRVTRDDAVVPDDLAQRLGPA